MIQFLEEWSVLSADKELFYDFPLTDIVFFRLITS